MGMPTGQQRLARALYENHGPGLERWARRRFDDGQFAEEVVQETVLVAWRKYDQFNPERGSERAWMFGIARNVAATRYRRHARHLRAVPTVSLRDEGVEDAELARITERSLIVDAVRSLSDDHRNVVAAAFWEGLSTMEIAARFSIPDGTVKSRLHYAMRILRSAEVRSVWWRW
jgi:RNA polymerase sigma-70 factor (ECF subfamily)